VNAKALWTLPRTEIKEEEYKSSTSTWRMASPTARLEPQQGRGQARVCISLLYRRRGRHFDLWQRDGRAD
jgi:hypothetical protein